MPRYVVLAHDWPTPHWDLLLEFGPVLKAWRLHAEPGSEWVPAEPNYDHRPLYLEYEGPLTGQRGHVRRWDAGTFDGDISRGEWQVLFHGNRFRGRGELAAWEAGYRFRIAAGG